MAAATTAMPRGAHSAASSRVSCSTAARAAPVCAIAGMPWCGETVTLTTVPPSAPNPAPDRGAGHRVRPVDVEPAHGAPALGRDLLGGDEVLAAGVVDQHVEAPVALADGLDDPRRVGGLADVAGDVGAALADLRRGLLEHVARGARR